MDLLLKLTVGLVFAVGFYLVLQRSLLQLVLGLAVLGHAANLLVFVAAGLTPASAPLIAEDGTVPGKVDPLPQAMILTAIVISFGVIGFTLALIHRVSRSIGVLDIDDLRSTDALDLPDHDPRSEAGR